MNTKKSTNKDLADLVKDSDGTSFTDESFDEHVKKSEKSSTEKTSTSKDSESITSSSKTTSSEDESDKNRPVDFNELPRHQRLMIASIRRQVVKMKRLLSY
jgi:hypothetical protein